MSVSIMLHNNDSISIEEILVKPKNVNERSIRQFILLNRLTNLKICIYTLGARVMSCLLNEHEIIVDNNDNLVDDIPIMDDDDDGDLEFAKDDYYWESHVYGSDTVLFNNRQDIALFGKHRTLTYSLTKNDEFIVEGNNFRFIDLKTLLLNPFFINLNSYDSETCLDEHYLHIKASHESINVFTEQALYGQFSRNIPMMIPRYLNGSDFIYSTNPTSIPNSFLIATLSYRNRNIEISLELDKQTKTSLRILIKNGSIAFVPHDMDNFRVTYRFFY